MSRSIRDMRARGTERAQMNLSFAEVLVLLMTLGGCGASAMRPGVIPPSRLSSSTSIGFESLATERVGSAMFGKVESATTRRQLAALWRRLRFPGPIPVVDFDAYVVVAWVGEDGVCPREVATFDLTADRRLTVRSSGASCFWEGTYAHAVAIARMALPRDRFILVVPDRFENQRPVAVKPVNLPSAAPTKPLPPRLSPTIWPSDGTQNGVAALPPPGQVECTLLDDGTPVWMVRHPDGGIDALAADDPWEDIATRGGVRGLHTRVSWDGARRRFRSILQYHSRGIYDEYGVPVFGRYRPLDRYQVQRIPEDPMHVRIGRRIEGTMSRLVAPLAHEDCHAGDCLVHPLPTSVMSVGDARQAPRDQVVLIDAALQLRGGAPARLCYDPCPADAPVAEGVSVPPGIDSDVCGPVLVRVHDGRFAEVVLTRWGWTATREGCRPPASPAASMRTRPPATDLPDRSRSERPSAGEHSLPDEPSVSRPGHE